MGDKLKSGIPDRPAGSYKRPKPTGRRVRLLRKTGDAVRYRTFPVLRARPGRRVEYQVHMGFDTQEDAELWIDDAINAGLLQPDKDQAAARKPRGGPTRKSA